MMTSLTRRQCILDITVAILAAVYAALPTLMAALLKHMFTAPNQVPWTGGGHLRLIDIDGMPAQTLYSVERAHELVSSSFQHKQGDVWVASYVKSGTTWTIGILSSRPRWTPRSRICRQFAKGHTTVLPTARTSRSWIRR